MLTLYQFPISHYCEKARWALEHKNIAYKKVNLLPGLHVKKAKKLAAKSALPILIHNNKVINESSKIINYLDQTFPDNCLTPKEKTLREKALAWEAFADKELGPDVRSLCYFTLLDHPEIIIPYFTDGGPWYGDLYLKFYYPKLSQTLRKFMQLNDENIKHIKQRLTVAINEVYQHINNRKYFVGDSFSRADLAVASLLAPLCRPNKYGLEWPAQFPEPLHSSINELSDQLDWVSRMYKQHR